MIAKSYKTTETEIIMTKNNNLYNVIRITKSKDFDYVRDLAYEEADDVYSYLMDMELENDK